MSSTSRYFNYSDQAARYVEGLLDNSKSGSQLTTTITLEKSGGFSVHIVTIELSDDTAETTLKFYEDVLPTSIETTQDG